MLWYWGRGGDGTPTAQLPIEPAAANQFGESMLTQPLLMNEVHRQWAQAQAHSDAIAALADARRGVWIVLSMTSYYASASHSKAIYNVVEALTSLGTPFGFVSAEQGQARLQLARRRSASG